jgi:deglycase
MSELTDKRVAFLVTDGVYESELTAPLEAAREAGAEVVILGPEKGEQVQAVWGLAHGSLFTVDESIADASAENFDALVIPGGLGSPDTLRLDKGAVSLVRRFVDSGKTVAAVCHGPQLLVEADAVRGRRMTTWPSIATDMRNAGANWVDEEVVVDSNMITSRGPDDLPAFSRAIVEHIASQEI